jgi:hypothetical protein
VQTGESQTKSRAGDGKEVSALDARFEGHVWILGDSKRGIKWVLVKVFVCMTSCSVLGGGVLGVDQDPVVSQ